MSDPHSLSFSTLRCHRFASVYAGPRLIVLGAVHGNETCGTHALERLRAELDTGAIRLVRGQLTLVPITNPLAHHKGERMGERNLNRNLNPRAQPQDYEDRIANVLCPLLAEHDVLLDLHSFHTPGKPFAMLGPPNNPGPLEPFSLAAEEESLACRLGPQRLVEGWLDTFASGVRNRQARANTQAQTLTAPGSLNTQTCYGIGTTEYMRSQGGYGITLECGQHADPQAPEVAYRGIRNTLAHLQMVNEPSPAPCADLELLRLCEVTDRWHADDQFAQPWSSYDPLRAGEVVGHRADGTPVCAPHDGFIVFPNPRALPGYEWFYFAQRSERVLCR